MPDSKSSKNKSDAKSKKSPIKAALNNEQIGARRTMLEELFNDMYDDRRNIYFMNFIRGIFFGFGSVLGGTVLIAITITTLSQFVDWFPVLGDFINRIIEAMNRTR